VLVQYIDVTNAVYPFNRYNFFELNGVVLCAM